MYPDLIFIIIVIIKSQQNYSGNMLRVGCLYRSTVVDGCLWVNDMMGHFFVLRP